MGVKVNYTIPLANIEFITADDMRELGLFFRERIIRRTIDGQGVDGPFAPYSPGYAKAKAKALGAAAGNHVNLQVSGAMLNDITVTDARGWFDDDGPLVELGFSK
jgi:hypothetical protein